MNWNILFYPLLIASMYAVVYLVLFLLFPYFFNQRSAKFSKKQIFSIPLVIFLSLLIWQVSVVMADQQLANRLLHAIGGGALAFFTCFLAAKDSQVRITRFQFFIFSFLIVASLGVANELLEFFLQTATGEIFSDSPIDTWFDLTSNTAGALIASIFLVPLFKKGKQN